MHMVFVLKTDILGPKYMILAFFKSFTLPGGGGFFPKYMFLHKDDVQSSMSDVLGQDSLYMGSNSFMHCCVIIVTLKFLDKPIRGIPALRLQLFLLLDDIFLCKLESFSCRVCLVLCWSYPAPEYKLSTSFFTLRVRFLHFFEFPT